MDTLKEIVKSLSRDISEQASKHLSSIGTVDFASELEHRLPWLFTDAIL